MSLHSVFKITSKNRDKSITTYLAFYQGVVQNDPNDWRFIITKTRTEVTLLGTISTDFPVKYPLMLDNGVIIQEDEFYRYKEKLGEDGR